MSFIKSKRGQATEMSLAHIIDLGLAMLAILLLVSFVSKASTGEFIDEKKVVLNTGLLIDTVLSANGNTFLSIDIANNTLTITDNKVESGEIWTQSFYVLEDQNTQTISDIEFKGTKNIELFKTGNKLYIKKEVTQISSLSCPYSIVEEPSNVVILPKTKENGEDDSFTFSLQSALTIQGIATERVNNLTTPTNLAIKILQTESNIIKVGIPFNSPESRRLACSITNELQIKNPTLEAKIVVVEDILFKNSDNAIILTINDNIKNRYTTIALSKVFKSTFT